MRPTVPKKPEDTWSTRSINSEAHPMENFPLSAFPLGRVPENSGCERDDTTQPNPCAVPSSEPVSWQWGFTPAEAHVPLGEVCKDNFTLKSKHLHCQALSFAHLGPLSSQRVSADWLQRALDQEILEHQQQLLKGNWKCLSNATT